MGRQIPPKNKGARWHSSTAHFLAHVYCGQMAGWIKMPFGTEVRLGPGHIVLDGNPATSPPPIKINTQQPHHFSAHDYCGQTAGWITMPLRMEFSHGPDDILLHRDPAPSTERGTAVPPPTFRRMSFLAKRSPISAASELFHLIASPLAAAIFCQGMRGIGCHWCCNCCAQPMPKFDIG